MRGGTPYPRTTGTSSTACISAREQVCCLLEALPSPGYCVPLTAVLQAARGLYRFKVRLVLSDGGNGVAPSKALIASGSSRRRPVYKLQRSTVTNRRKPSQRPDVPQDCVGACRRFQTALYASGPGCLHQCQRCQQAAPRQQVGLPVPQVVPQISR